VVFIITLLTDLQTTDSHIIYINSYSYVHTLNGENSFTILRDTILTTNNELDPERPLRTQMIYYIAGVRY